MIKGIVIEWQDEAKTVWKPVNMDAKVEFLPVRGISPNLEFLVSTEPFEKPDYDPRVVNLLVSKDIGEISEVPEHANHKTYETRYELVQKSADEKKLSIKESKNLANLKVFPVEDQLEYLTMALTVLDRKISGMNISPRQQVILDRVNRRAVSIWQNNLLETRKAADIDNGDPVNIDSGWVELEANE